jgi:dethiobiotin synthetase
MNTDTTSHTRGFFITATDTGVGKTFVGTQLVRALTARGIAVAVRKPAESGCEEIEGELLPADAQALWDAAAQREPLSTVCPLRFRHALSPARAAALEGHELTLDMLARAAKRDAGSAWLHVEGAGGICSPMASDGLNADLAQGLGLPLVLVVPDRLGGINQALMGEAALRDRGLELAAIVLNTVQADQDPAMDNRAELVQYTDVPVFRMGHGERADATRLAEYLMGYRSGE